MKTVQYTDGSRTFTVGKILCIGRNYAEHAREMNSPVPDRPVVFIKPTTALLANEGIIERPSYSKEMHHEVELVLVIAKEGKNILAPNAAEHIGGFGVGLDMTLRDLQSRAKQDGLPWALAKGFDTSAPISSFAPPWAVKDPLSMRIELKVNGEIRQIGMVRDMIFPLLTLIEKCSECFTLEEGDLVYTGTPAGVGSVRSGDTLESALYDGDGTLLTSLVNYVH